MEHIERLAYGGRIEAHRSHRVRRFAAVLALLGALIHSSEHVLLYFEGFGAARELLVITRLEREI